MVLDVGFGFELFHADVALIEQRIPNPNPKIVSGLGIPFLLGAVLLLLLVAGHGLLRTWEGKALGRFFIG